MFGFCKEKGISAAEYGLLIALVAAVVVGVLTLFLGGLEIEKTAAPAAATVEQEK